MKAVEAAISAEMPGHHGEANSRRRITVSSPTLYRRQIIHLLIFNVGPAFGAILAIAWAVNFGFTWLDVALLVSFYFLTLFGVEIGFHRCLAHRAFKCGDRTLMVLVALGCAAAQGSASYWVATHRRHHAFSDETNDPHSPERGFWHAHMGWLLERETTLTPRFASDVMRFPAVRKIEPNYYVWVAVGMLLPGWIGGVAGWSLSSMISGFLWGGPLRLFLAQQGSFLINSACHTFGKQPFQTGDRSRNFHIMSIISLGQSLHNNHHAFPRSATTALQPRDLDIGGLSIKAMAHVGLAKDVVIPDAEAISHKLDFATTGVKTTVSIN